MKYLLAALSAAALLAPQAAFADAESDYEALREEIWEYKLDNDPLLAMRIGDRRGDGTLPDGSLRSYETELRDEAAFLDRLDAIDADALPEDMQVDYAILRRDLADGIEAGKFDHERYTVIGNRYGPHTFAGYLTTLSPLFTRADYQSYIARLDALPALVDQMIDRSRGAIDKGLTLPCEPMQGYAEGITASAPASVEDSQVWGPFREKPAAISEADWTALRTRARRVIADDVNASLRKFAAFYSSEYAPKCRTGAPGLISTPGGDDYYGYLVRSYTTTQMTADDVHALGLSEVARIRAEMEQVASEAGYDTREAFIEHLRTDPQYYAKTPDELMMRTSALAKEIDGWMPKLFGKLPRLPYTVLPIPEALAPGNTTAYYNLGSLANGAAGVYRVNTTELDQRPLWELPALTVHEAVPGHHHQLALQQELDIHPLRTHGTFFTAFVEGWGLYSERLGIEMGLYDTPANQMGRLSYEMWRATRLVVDTGIHAKGWSKQRAVDYMLDNTALTPANIDAEVNRYITTPGQALAYKLGELKIRELRTRAENTLGENFDLRGFHDAVLENGSVPLDVLEAQVDRWIAGQQASAG